MRTENFRNRSKDNSSSERSVLQKAKRDRQQLEMIVPGSGPLEKVLYCLSASGLPLTAKAISALTEVSRADVNSVLYSNQSKFEKLEGKTPLWALVGKSTEEPNKLRDRMEISLVETKSVNLTLNGVGLRVDFYTYEASRNDALYKVEVKEPDHILVGLVKTFSSEPTHGTIDTTQSIILAVSCLEALTRLGAFQEGQTDWGQALSKLIKILASQV